MNQFERFSSPQPSEEMVEPSSISPEAGSDDRSLSAVKEIFQISEKDNSATILRVGDGSYVVEKAIAEKQIEGSKIFNVYSRVEKGLRNDEKWNVKDLTFSDTKGSIDVCALLPDGVQLFIDPTKSNHYNFVTKEINIISIASAENVRTVLHEVGHALDYEKSPAKEGEFSAGSPRQMEEWVRDRYIEKPEEVADLIKLGMTRERNAWAEAIHLARNNMPEIQGTIHEGSQECLKTYDRSMASAITRGSDAESFASSEQRAAMRNKEKAADAMAMYLIGIKAKKLESQVESAVGVPIERLNDVHPNIQFKDPDQEKVFFLQFPGRSILSVSQYAPIGENGKYSLTNALVGGLESAQMNHSAIELDSHGKVISETKLLNGKIEVLKEAGESENVSITYVVVSDVLDRLGEPRVNEAFLIQAFRDVYSDAPEPYRVDPQTGENLSLTQKLEYMREKSPMYQARNNTGGK